METHLALRGWDPSGERSEKPNRRDCIGRAHAGGEGMSVLAAESLAYLPALLVLTGSGV